MPPKKGQQQAAQPKAAAPAATPATPAAAKAAPAEDAPLVLATRSKEGVRLLKGTGETLGQVPFGEPIPGDFSECELAFTADGAFMAAASTKAVFIVNCEHATTVAVLEQTNITDLLWSPRGDILTTYRLQDAKRPGEGNMAFWRVDTNSGTVTELLRCGQSTWPAVFWSSDASTFIRRSQGHLLQLHDGALEKKEVLATLDTETPKGKEPVVACSTADVPFVAVFVPQVKQRMAKCDVYRSPNIKEPLLSRTFGRGDSASIQWSKSGGALTICVRSEHDKSGGSYYGNSTLTVMNVRDRDCVNVALGKDEGVHDCQWSPTADEFIVIHGAMPRNKATLYNVQGQAVYSFGEAPRNFVTWSPNGKMFLLGGNGNMAGDHQFYHRESVAKRGDGKHGFFSEKTSVQIWAPDSRHLVSANIFSRLRLDNKWTVWKYTGEKVASVKFDQLFTAVFVPYPHKRYTERPLEPIAVQQTAVKPQAYRPPGGGSSAAATMLSRNPASAIGNAVRPASAGPVGAAVVEEPKKRRKR